MNYLYGVPFWSVSIAARELTSEPADRSLVGVVHAPVLGMTWTALPAAGAPRDGRRCAGRRRRRSSRHWSAPASATSPPAAAGRPRCCAGCCRGYATSAASARPRSTCAWPPRASLDAYFEQGLKPWDRAAGSLIAREAGLTVAGLDGAPPGGLTIAAPPALFGPLTALLAAGAPRRPRLAAS